MTAIFAPIRMIEDQLAALVARNGIFCRRSGCTDPAGRTRATSSAPRSRGTREAKASIPRLDQLAPRTLRTGREPGGLAGLAGPGRTGDGRGGDPRQHGLLRLWLDRRQARGGPDHSVEQAALRRLVQHHARRRRRFRRPIRARRVSRLNPPHYHPAPVRWPHQCVPPPPRSRGRRHGRSAASCSGACGRAGGRRPAMGCLAG